MSTYFWSDTHFNHTGIATHCPTTRPHSELIAFNEYLIDCWNLTVGKRDRIFLVGDFGFTTRDGWRLDEIFARLNGEKHLIVGNHDEKNKLVLKLPWVSIHDLVTVRENGMRTVCCHYPMETWKNAQRGYLMLYGHSHGSLKTVLPHRFDVGVDAEGRDGPLSFEQLWDRSSQQSFCPVDHHGD